VTEEPAHLLYVAADATTFYLLPADLEPGTGNLRLVSLDGPPKLVDAAAVAGFEVSRQQARAHVRTSVEQLMSSVLGGSQFSSSMLADLPRYVESAQKLDPATATRAAALGLRALADALEPEAPFSAAGARLDAFVQRCERELGPLLEGAHTTTTRDDVYRDSARRSIGDALRAAGITALNVADRSPST
jgi:hypothetical protein